MEIEILILISSLLLSCSLGFDLFESYGIVCFFVCMNKVVIWLLDKIYSQKEKNPSQSDQD